MPRRLLVPIQEHPFPIYSDHAEANHRMSPIEQEAVNELTTEAVVEKKPKRVAKKSKAVEIPVDTIPDTQISEANIEGQQTGGSIKKKRVMTKAQLEGFMKAYDKNPRMSEESKTKAKEKMQARIDAL